MDEKNDVKNVNQSQYLMGTEVISVEFGKNEGHTCFIKSLKNGKAAYCLIKDIYQNHDCVKSDLITYSSKDDELDDNQKLILTTIYLAQKELGNIELSDLNKLNELCFKLYVNSNKSHPFFEVVEAICDKLKPALIDGNLSQEIDDLCSLKNCESINIFDVFIKNRERKKEVVIRNRRLKAEAWEAAMINDANLTIEQLRRLIKKSSDIISLFGCEVFYNTLSYLSLDDLTEVVTVVNDTYEYKEYIKEGYPIVDHKAVFARTERVRLDMTGLWKSAELSYDRNRTYSSTKFRVLKSNQDKQHMMAKCFRASMAGVKNWPMDLTVIYEEKLQSGEYIATIKNAFGHNECSVYVPLRAIVDNDFDAIIKFHMSQYEERIKENPWHEDYSSTSTALRALSGPSLSKVKAILQHRGVNQVNSKKKKKKKKAGKKKNKDTRGRLPINRKTHKNKSIN